MIYEDSQHEGLSFELSALPHRPPNRLHPVDSGPTDLQQVPPIPAQPPNPQKPKPKMVPKLKMFSGSKHKSQKEDNKVSKVFNSGLQQVQP